MDYDEYIKTHPRWQQVRKARLDFDEGRCVICHTDLRCKTFNTHHLNYDRLGSEHIRDVITLCERCHTIFHNVWKQQDFWKGREPGHWEVYDINHTAVLCASLWCKDRFITKNPDDPNLCDPTTIRNYVSKYLKSIAPETPTIDSNDIQLFIRNKRYELFFEAEQRGLTMEQFLDEYYGAKVRGKNPMRQMAGTSSTFKHTPKSMHAHYKENKNITKLMEVTNYAETKQLF